MLPEIEANLAEILGESTAYGLPKLFKSKRFFFKIFWLAYFLTGCIASIYFTVDLLNSYLEYEVIQKTEIITENEMTFPTITLCSDSFNNNNEPLKDIIQLCKFDFNNNDCQTNPDNYFFKFYFYEFKGQNCLQFNSGKNMSNHSIPILNSTLGGDDQYGLSLFFEKLINTPMNIYIDDPSLPSFINGIKYKIFDFTAEPKTKYFILLSKTEQYKLSMPYNPCYKDVFTEFPLNKTILNFFQSNNVAYKQKYCYQLCAELDYLETNPCDCKKNTKLNYVRQDCFHDNRVILSKQCTNNYLNNFKKKIAEKCSKYCPLECNSIEYTFSTRNYYTNENIRLFIYFKEMEYTKLSEMPKIEPFDLISNIGGILGLFIGCSFVSLFELVEIFLEVYFILFSNKNNKQIKWSESKETKEITRSTNQNEMKIGLKNNTIKNESLIEQISKVSSNNEVLLTKAQDANKKLKNEINPSFEIKIQQLETI